MEKKRSKGVTFWGWIFIVSAIIGLLSAISPQRQIHLYGTAIVVFGMISSLAYLICGIFILKLNDNARKTAIALGIISIIVIPFYLKPILNMPNSNSYYAKAKQRIAEQVKPEFQQKALEDLEKSKTVVGKVVPIFFIVIFVVPILLIELIPIYFFTRPKVKEQFDNS